MKNTIRIFIVLAGLCFAHAAAFAQQPYYPNLSLTCTASPIFPVKVYGDYGTASSPSFSSGVVFNYSATSSISFTPPLGPPGETYQLRELTFTLGGSAEARFNGTELFGTSKPLGASGRTVYVYLANPGAYSFYIY